MVTTRYLGEAISSGWPTVKECLGYSRRGPKSVIVGYRGRRLEGLSQERAVELEQRGGTTLAAGVHTQNQWVARHCQHFGLVIHEDASWVGHVAAFITHINNDEGFGVHHDGGQRLLLLQLAGQRLIDTWEPLPVGQRQERARCLPPTGESSVRHAMEAGDMLLIEPWTPHRVLASAGSYSLTFGYRRTRLADNR